MVPEALGKRHFVCTPVIFLALLNLALLVDASEVLSRTEGESNTWIEQTPITDEQVTLILGATGRTGSLLYHQLRANEKQKHEETRIDKENRDRMLGASPTTVRALVRDVAKARQVLGCVKCDSSEGIFVGDLVHTPVPDLLPAFANVTTLAIATGASGRGEPSTKDLRAIEFDAIQKAVFALGQHPNFANNQLHIILCSSRGTTSSPSTSSSRVFSDILFYKLNAEAFLGSVGMRTSIVKPCGLSMDEGSNRTLVALHDDAPTSTGSQMVPRADVARVMMFLAIHPPSVNLRFDLCSIEGPGTTDIEGLVSSAYWVWEKDFRKPI